MFTLTAAGCASVPFIDAAQPHALDAAQRRAQFESNCPAATGQVISRELIQTGSAPMRGWMPPQRAEYTIGVAGCNERRTYLVICAEGGGCVAGGGRGEK